MTTGAQDQLGGAVKESWRRFLDTYEPLRPELYRYCRHLTRSPWDAEDMAQEALARAFVTLGIMTEPPRHPRAWLFRVASNLWLNRTRDARELPAAFGADAPEPAASAEPRETREAAGTLMAQLSPQERAAPVPPAVLDAFCDAFNARDLDWLTALLLDTAAMEYPGFKIEEGARAIRAGSLQGTLFGCPEEAHEPAPPPRCELRAHRGESIFLWWSGDEVHAVVRIEVEGDRIARLRSYYHSPEVVAEVCREIGVPFRTHGYHPVLAGREELP